ncbi:MAG: HWE histidine kinase domain-containing protein [Devosia sp.]|nr:HWE histidine kinase domain-containing protein [Devosia sp.]
MCSISQTSEAGRDSIAEGLRREVIDAIKALDSQDDPDFRRVARTAARLFSAPIGVITLLDGERLWFYARHGLSQADVSAAHSFEASIVWRADPAPLVVLDAAADADFALGQLVIDEPHVRFYAGASISVRGQKVGALGVLAPEPREAVDASLLEELSELAALCSSLFELKDEARVRARMAADLIREEWRHALTLEAGRVGSWVWDLRSGEIVANDIFRQMLGFPVLGPLHIDDLMAAIDANDIDGVNQALAATFDEGVDYNVEFRVGATGRWLVGRGRVYQRDGSGKPLIMMGVNIDVTEAREAADQTRLLLRELNHRVKNTLAMIQSLARQTLRQKPNPRQFLEAFSGRLRTLSEAHVLLADRDWSGVGLVELVHSQVEPYLLNSPDQLALSGDDVKLPPDQALGLGLILHELTSNAVKFGALSRAGGRVSVSWAVSRGAEPRVDVQWKESGGPKVTKPPEAGFGTRLIQRGLDKILDSSVSLAFPEDGAEARISFPLA